MQIEKLRPYKFLNIQLAKEASSLNKKAQGHFVLREKVQGLIEIKIIEIDGGAKCGLINNQKACQV
jgi:hypothetical protein